MANIKQQKKRILVAERQRMENIRYRSSIKTAFRRVVEAVQGGDATVIDTAHTEYVSLIDRATAFLVAEVDASFPDLPVPHDRLVVALESVVRLVLSHITRPSAPVERTAEDLGWLVATVFIGVAVADQHP